MVGVTSFCHNQIQFDSTPAESQENKPRVSYIVSDIISLKAQFVLKHQKSHGKTYLRQSDRNMFRLVGLVVSMRNSVWRLWRACQR
jgi:hypothetical protein